MSSGQADGKPIVQEHGKATVVLRYSHIMQTNPPNSKILNNLNWLLKLVIQKK